VQNGQSSVSHTARPLSHCINIVLLAHPSHPHPPFYSSSSPMRLACQRWVLASISPHIPVQATWSSMVVASFPPAHAERLLASLSPTTHSHSGNVVIEGGGTIDGDGDHWYTDKATMNNERPMMLDLLWVDGLTVRDMRIRRPGYASPSLVCTT
jgi:hypothetical protein